MHGSMHVSISQNHTRGRTDILLLLVLISASVNGVGMSGYLGLVDPLNYVPNVGVTIGISHELEEGEE